MSCTVSAVPAQVRSEGLTERVGDITLQCSGGTPGTTVGASLTVLLPVSITNRINPDSTTADVHVTTDAASGPIPAGRVTSQSITFSGLSFTVPASGIFSIHISNLRANVHQLATQAPTTPLQAQLSVNPPSGISLNTNSATVALASPGLLASYASTGIRCSGSPVPSTVSISGLFAAGTRFFSTRFTEGFATSFQPRNASAGDDTGTRFLIRYSGLPAGLRLFVPDAIAGSGSAQQTAAGDLGLTPSGGQYLSGSGALLLVRVLYTDPNGAAGTLATPAELNGSGTLTFDSASEVSLSGGAGMVVYEVVAANAQVQENAQIPTFLSLASVTANAVGQEEVSFAPVSTAASADALDPVPRFAATTPGSDCSVLGDCGASYFPTFAVIAQPVVFTATAGGPVNEIPGYIAVQNQSGGIMTWTASVSYQSGSGWISLDQTSGINSGSVRVFAKPQTLAPGTYQATVTIDAGALGVKTVPVSLTVSPAPTPPAPSVVVTSVVNAATFAAGPLAPGALATVLGTNLSGQKVSVTFDGTAATLLYTSATQINLQIPTQLTGRASTQLIVTADGNSSAPQTVNLAALAPGIFGILNQDNSLNAPATPAAPGSILQIFVTGLPSTGSVDVLIADRDLPVPVYPYSGASGVEQVNVAVPDGLSATTTTLQVCGYDPTGQKICSPSAQLSLRQ